MRTADFDYDLPKELIAQEPAPKRDQSRLLVLTRCTGAIEHRVFSDIVEYLVAGDVLVLNDSRVIPARLRGRSPQTGGRFEVLLLEEIRCNHWLALVRPGRRTRVGARMDFTGSSGLAVSGEIVARRGGGQWELQFLGVENVAAVLGDLGEVPLPPYIRRHGPVRSTADRERYQTVYARANGSVAAPTAGLHFTEQLLKAIRTKGVELRFVTLHIGVGTFAPVRMASVEAHRMHQERYEVSTDTAAAITGAKKTHRRVIAVGTTTVRVLESIAAQTGGLIVPGSGRTGLFIYPPFEFKIVDALLTNFHLPRSTLLMLVSAFAAPGQTTGRELVLQVYREAILRRYRFYSYGDAMLIL